MSRAVQIGFLISGITSATTGHPVAGGEVFFYEAGTTTPKYAYTEKEKTNGFYSYDLDAIGAATLYGDGEYKIVIKDSVGATVKTLDYMRLRYEYFGVQNISSTPYSHTSDHDLFLVDTTAGAITINMLAAALWDRPIKVMRTAGANNIVIDPSGSETIDGAATLTISSDAIVEIISDGSNLVSVGFRSNMFDADNDTGIQVEETADDDTIRFDTGGTERVTITTTKVTSNIPIEFNSHQDADGDTKVQVEETTDEDKVRIDTGGVEKALFSGTATESYVQVNSHQDADGDTKIQVEEAADEDKVRIDTGGTERVVIDSNGLDIVSGNLLIAGGAATATPTAGRVPLYDGSGRLKSGAAPSADTDVVRLVDITTVTEITPGGDLNGGGNPTLLCKTGSTVTLHFPVYSTSGTTPSSTAGIIPAAFRPRYDVYNTLWRVVTTGTTHRIKVTSAGTIEMSALDASHAATAPGNTYSGTLSWVL